LPNLHMDSPGPQTTTKRGLTNADAEERLAQYGLNSPPAPRYSPITELLRVVANPLVLILLIASLISAIVGELLSAFIIVSIVGLSMSLDFVQSYRSQRAAEALLESVAPTATVLRDGIWQEINRAYLVPGDIIRLSPGDLIPADGRLLESQDLHVQEAALTGESIPVVKTTVTTENDGDASVFLGTSVITGSGIAEVTATGERSEFGDIARRLAERPPETEFERGTRDFGLLITRTVIVLVLLVIGINLGVGRGLLETVLFAVALAVGLTPEFLPMILSITLTRGAVQMSRRKVIVKHTAAIENFGSLDVLCSDKTGTLTHADIRLEDSVGAFGGAAPTAIQLAVVNSKFSAGIHSPLDAAILRHEGGEGDAWRKIDEIPFDFDRRRMSVVAESDGRTLLITKGAPESVLPVCSRVEINGGVESIDDAARARCEATFQRLSSEGLRVLAVAWRDLEYHGSTRADQDEHDLVLAGFLTFLDPPLPDARETISQLRADGIEVKVLTGDNDLVARHVCSSVGIETSNMVTGDEIDTFSDEELTEIVERVSVFSRVSPGQKHRIVLALKRAQHVVGYIGDGINDAPSLHAADVGISVANAVDVARDSADIILLERSLAVLHEGIQIGRRTFGNVMKYILMSTSSNFGNVLSMAVGSAVLPFLPMLPAQILLNNFLYEASQVAIPSDNVDESFAHRPRRWDVGIIRRFMLFIGPVSTVYDLATFAVLLYVLRASEQEFHTGWFIESLTTQTLVLFVIRTAGNPFKSRPSWPLSISVVVVVVLGIVLPMTPLGSYLGFTSLPMLYYIFLVIATVTYLFTVEIMKRRILR
jgi:P-type Mg2+ transporter